MLVVFGCSFVLVMLQDLQIGHIYSSRKYCEKAGSPRVLRKQDHFRWKLFESSMDFVESSTKSVCLSLRALRKQDQDVFWAYSMLHTIVPFDKEKVECVIPWETFARIVARCSHKTGSKICTSEYKPVQIATCVCFSWVMSKNAQCICCSLLFIANIWSKYENLTLTSY